MEHPTARLIMVMGLPGSGKTYFAKALAVIGPSHTPPSPRWGRAAHGCTCENSAWQE
ncbi:MAG: hypothetical protein IPH05_17395 [Flavobacteriales bacterium]|nr:hypothetical protein [Flavobacteriales bacterium]